MKLAMRLALLVAPVLSTMLASAPAEAQIRDITRRVFDDAPEPGYVPTPYGWTHETCVFVAESSARIERTGAGGFTVSRSDGTRAQVPTCRFKPIKGDGPQVIGVTRTDMSQIGDAPPPPTVKGWALASAAYAEKGTYWTQIHTSWTVPPPPSRSGALLYFFNGLEPADGNTVVQPVLQYGVSPAGGGDYWAATSWLVAVSADGTQSVFSADGLQPVAPGTQINGHVNASGCNQAGGCSWSIWLDGPRGVFGWLNVPNHPATMVWAFRAVAEFYSVDTCDQLPVSRSITFSNNRVIDSLGRERDAQVTWRAIPFAVTPNCGNKIEHFTGGAKLRF